jgi:predicted type IV restriction endonuclease
MAGFEVIIYGRFWVIAEAYREGYHGPSRRG